MQYAFNGFKWLLNIFELWLFISNNHANSFSLILIGVIVHVTSYLGQYVTQQLVL